MNTIDSKYPLAVGKVEVHGVKYTKSVIFEKAVTQLLLASDLESIVQHSIKSTAYLSKFDIFSSVEILIKDPNERNISDNPLEMLSMLKKSYSTNRDPPKVANVMISVKKKKRLFLKTGTEFGANEGSVSASLLWRNVFGNGEKVEGSLSRGTRTTSSYDLTLTKPLIDSSFSSYTDIQTSVFSRETDWSEPCSYTIAQKGASLTMNRVFVQSSHALSLNFINRKYLNISHNASIYTRENAKSHLKDCIRYQYLWKNCDNDFLPTAGSAFRLDTEFAGLMTKNRFFKVEAQSQRAYDIRSIFTLVSTWRLGYIHSVSGDIVPLCDLFHIGGPLSLRGFSVRGAGPMTRNDLKPFKNDAIGGKFLLETGLSFFSPIPFLARFPNLKLHSFVNAGFVSQGINEWQDGIINHRASTGLGLCYRAANCRVELNFTKPVKTETSDKLSPLIQIGFGIEFL